MFTNRIWMYSNFLGDIDEISGSNKNINDVVTSTSNNDKDTKLLSCPKCHSTTVKIKSALYSFWRNDLYNSYACLCEELASNEGLKNDFTINLGEATMTAILNSKHALFQMNYKIKVNVNFLTIQM
jgi:hypothetical protein